MRAVLILARGPLWPEPLTGVGSREDLAQVLDADAGVELGALEALVAEELLDMADVGAALEQVCGAAVPQHVRREGRGIRAVFAWVRTITLSTLLPIRVPNLVRKSAPSRGFFRRSGRASRT
jgi:hypothetical protein